MILTTFIALFAYVYREILAEQPVLNWWFRWGIRFEKRWFYKPIWGCILCISGQWALWIYVLNWIASYFNGNAPFWTFLFKVIPKYHPTDFNVFSGGLFISLTIFQIYLLNQILIKWNLKN